MTKEDGSVVQRSVSLTESELFVRFLFPSLVLLTRPLASLQLRCQQLIDVSDNIAKLTRVTDLAVRSRFFLVLR
ncbi:MAG: hypothetical protein IV100_25095 [Myxococcales bacterium]|nr:hypothetical protein [Myxococcales bacterium]